MDAPPAGVPEDELMESPLVAPAELLECPAVAVCDRAYQLLVGRHRRPGRRVSYERASRDGVVAVRRRAGRHVPRWGRGRAAQVTDPLLRGPQAPVQRGRASPGEREGG